MSKLLQIVYVSRSTSPSTSLLVNKIEPNIARILTKSRINNRKNGLVGVLYFGDGVFFQCLEGEEGAVNTLLKKLESDTRHKDLKVISRKYVPELSFGEWAMKFAPLDKKIGVFLKENGFETFDPYTFSPQVTEKFLNQLFNVNDPTLDLNMTMPSTAELEAMPVKQPAQQHNTLALILSGMAFVMSLVALLTSYGLL